jgi:hypothetical protein
MAATSSTITFTPKSVNGRQVGYSATSHSDVMSYALSVAHKDQGKKLLTTMTLKCSPDRAAALGGDANDKLPATLNISFTRDKLLAQSEQIAFFEILNDTLTNSAFEAILDGNIVTDAFDGTFLTDILNWSPVV